MFTKQLIRTEFVNIREAQRYIANDKAGRPFPSLSSSKTFASFSIRGSDYSSADISCSARSSCRFDRFERKYRIWSELRFGAPSRINAKGFYAICRRHATRKIDFKSELVIFTRKRLTSFGEAPFSFVTGIRSTWVPFVPSKTMSSVNRCTYIDTYVVYVSALLPFAWFIDGDKHRRNDRVQWYTSSSSFVLVRVLILESLPFSKESLIVEKLFAVDRTT